MTHPRGAKIRQMPTKVSDRVEQAMQFRAAPDRCLTIPTHELGEAAAGAPSGLRKSLSEVLGQELAESLAKAASSQGPTEAELDALFGGATGSSGLDSSRGTPDERGGSPGEPSSSSHAAAAHGSIDAAGKLVHARYGYAALGGVMPTTPDVAPATSGVDVGSEGSGSVASSLLMSFQAQPRLHPRRSFIPGQSYEPSVSLAL